VAGSFSATSILLIRRHNIPFSTRFSTHSRKHSDYSQALSSLSRFNGNTNTSIDGWSAVKVDGLAPFLTSQLISILSLLTTRRGHCRAALSLRLKIFFLSD
jgi:hypothetical protein